MRRALFKPGSTLIFIMRGVLSLVRVWFYLLGTWRACGASYSLAQPPPIRLCRSVQFYHDRKCRSTEQMMKVR